MALYPRHGERYQHRSGWTVRIIGMIYRESVRIVNPEFYCEVRFIYESSGHYTEMPISWFNDVYRKISNAPRDYRRHEPKIKRYQSIPDYSWLDDDDK